MKRLLFVILSTILLFSAVFAGCQPSQPLTPTIVQQGQVLNLADADPITLDPALSAEAGSHGYVMQIYSGMVQLNEKLEPAPDIAERWQVDSSGTIYTFHLRKDVRFHNGKAVKAADFKYSWERAASPATGSQTVGAYLGDIVGVKEMLSGKSTEIRGVRVIDDYTLEVTIGAPKSYFLSTLTYPVAFVVDRDNVESGSGWWKKPNGTGPFKLKQWDKGSLLVLVKNELYYGDVPHLDAVNFRILSGVPFRMYETGDIDVTGIPAPYIDMVEDRENPFYQERFTFSELSFRYIGFNYKKPPFDDVNIRQAFSMTVNKDKIISVLYRDMVRRADGILPPGMPGYNEQLSGLPYDVNKAKGLIASSRYGRISNLPPITITTTGLGGEISSDLEAIISDWRQTLGVDVKVRQVEPDWFMYHIKDEVDNMYYMGWVADYPHPQDFLDLLFHSNAENNYGGYSNSQVDALLEKAAVEQSQDRSMALYQQVEQLLVNDAACIPIYFGENNILVKPYVKGYALSPVGYHLLKDVYIEPHLKSPSSLSIT